MKFVLSFGVGALAVKGVGAIERSAGIQWVYPALGCVSIVLVLTIAALVLKLKPKPKPAAASAA
jgi:NO-binding membrane sensor protein with MHYT domain